MAEQTILIIDDSDLTRAKLSAALEGQVTVALAENGKKGLEAALELEPDLILLDVGLPDIDGFRVCDAFKKDDRTKHIPLMILLEPEKDAKAAVRGLELGAADFIASPFEPEIVRARVKTQLELQDRRRELEQMAMVDALTGCFNRRYFMNAADMELSRRKRHLYDLVVAVLDVDEFASVSAEYGAEAGDAVLKEVAKVIDDAVRYEDSVGRIGDKEFAVMLPEANATGASIVLDRIRERIADLEFKHGGYDFSVTASIGLTEVEVVDMTMQDALSRAEEAVREAKENGRDQLLIR